VIVGGIIQSRIARQHDCWRAMADQECHEEVWADAGL
jgi:hypothetical protein